MSEHPAIEIDPRKVERMTRYLLRYAHQHACDPMEHRRREHLGDRFMARMRLRPSVLDEIALAREEGRPFHSPVAPDRWPYRCRLRLTAGR